MSSKAASLGETSKELARMWAETTDRTKYEQLAAADKERYEREKGTAKTEGPKRAPSPVQKKPVPKSLHKLHWQTGFYVI